MKRNKKHDNHYIHPQFNLKQTINFNVDLSSVNMDWLIGFYHLAVNRTKLELFLQGSGFDGRYVIISQNSIFSIDPLLDKFMVDINAPTRVYNEYTALRVVI